MLLRLGCNPGAGADACRRLRSVEPYLKFADRLTDQRKHPGLGHALDGESSLGVADGVGGPVYPHDTDAKPIAGHRRQSGDVVGDLATIIAL